MQNQIQNFLGPQEYLQNAISYRRKLETKSIADFGIDFLDQSIVGIHPSDMVVIAARSGCGKSELSQEICIHNAKKMKVALFKLEGCKFEFADTQLFKEIKKLHDYKWNEYRQGEPIIMGYSYLNYRMNKVRSNISELEKEAYANLKEKLKNLYIYDKSSGLSVNNIVEKLRDASKWAELICIDHLHYFDFLTGNENQEISEIVKAINETAYETQVPVIVISHIRKCPKDIIIPSMEDLMGSSNIFKIAYTVVIMSRYHEADDIQKNRSATIMRVAKSRSGYPENLVGLKYFDMNTKEYLPGYKKAILKNYDTKLELLNA